MLSASLPKFCPKDSCPCFQSTENKITKDGIYYVKSSGEKRQMFRCHGGQHRFSEMAYSDLINKKGSEKEYRQTAKLIKYGLSSEQIADVLERDPRTIESWVEAIAAKSKNFHNFICLLIGITIEFLQMDELWSYLGKKKDNFGYLLPLSHKINSGLILNLARELIVVQIV